VEEFVMEDLRERLARGVEILAALDEVRRQLDLPNWGQDTEYAIIVAELWDLEEDILRDPGALEPYVFVAPPQGA
jgi:hypothetical protein